MRGRNAGNPSVTRPKAYSYIRMSTPDQAKGDSTRRQDKATQKYAEEHNLELVDILIDEGVSAFAGLNVEEGKLGLFLAKAEKGEIDEGSYLIVESLDRISRETVPNALLKFQRIINSGVKIVTLFDGQIYSKKTLSERPYDLLMAILTLMRGHEESQVKSIRLKAAWENKREIARNGKNTRHVIPKWLFYSDASATIEPIPERASVIKEIYELSCAGMGSYSIAKKLNKSGYQPWGNANFWQESYIKKILHNRAVLGEYQPHVVHRESSRNVRVKIGEPISSYYPAIIDENLFLAAQNSARQRLQNGKGRKGKTLSNLFSGLIFCRHCGSSMRFMNKGASPKGGTYIRCSNSILTGKCQSRSYGYPIVEALVIGKLRQLDMKKIQMDREYRSQYSDLIEEKLFLETKLSATEEAIDYFMQLNDLTQLHQVAEKLIALQSEKETLTNSIIETNKLISDISVPETDINKKIQDYLNGKFSSDGEKLLARTNISHTIKSLLTKIEIYEEKIFPWDEDSDDNLLEGVYLNLHLYYRNGASQIWYGAKNSNLYMPPSEKMNLLKRRSALSNRD
jgi:DNA invertase Pin-like site-specific DNA recombinase